MPGPVLVQDSQLYASATRPCQRNQQPSDSTGRPQPPLFLVCQLNAHVIRQSRPDSLRSLTQEQFTTGIMIAIRSDL
jgi:hypothetical protein